MFKMKMHKNFVTTRIKKKRKTHTFNGYKICIWCKKKGNWSWWEKLAMQEVWFYLWPGQLERKQKELAVY